MHCSYAFVYNRKKTGFIELLLSFSNGKKVYKATKVKVAAVHWDESARWIRPKCPDFDILSDRLIKFKKTIEAIEMSSKDFSPEDLHPKVKTSTTPNSTVNELYRDLLRKRRRIKTSTHNDHQQTLKILDDFNDTISVRDLNLALVMEFDNFLVGAGFMDTTAEKHHKNFKTYCQLIIDTIGLDIENPYKNFDWTAETSKGTISLSEREIAKIHGLIGKLDMSRKAEEIIDIFVIACYTGVRYGDYKQLTEQNIKTIGKREVFHIYPNKVPVLAVIPIKPVVMDILKKYNYQLPSYSNNVINRAIKTICRAAEINKPIPIIQFKAGERVETTVPKYEKISAHTARRSAVTNMYYAGIPLKSIMRITTHRTERSFFRYIIHDPERDVESMIKHDFFN